MKNTISAISACLLLGGCLGASSSGNEMTGQVKRCQHVTPLIFFDYDRCDVSLGIMRNGVGSMSQEDVWIYVPTASHYAILDSASKSGALVNIKYDVARFRWYVEDDMVTDVHAMNGN